MDDEVFLKFKKLLKFVWENEYSDFYRLKFKKAGFNPVSDFNSLEDITKIPFLTKEELSSTDPSKLLFVPEKKIDHICPTSGTTKKPVFTFYSKDSPFNASYPHSYSRYGKHREHGEPRILTLCPLSSAYHFSWGAKHEGVNYLLVGDIHDIPSSCQLASRLRINTIFATPTLAIILKDYLEYYLDLKKSLKLFLLGGELVGPEKKKLLQELYPDVEISLVYGSSEAGGEVGFQCKYLVKIKSQIYYHAGYTDSFYLEVINPDTKKEVELGKRGELVLTNFWNSATPIIRYKTGDLVSFSENDCPCGALGPLLQIWGRVNYDMVRAGGFDLRTEMLEKPLLILRDYLQNNFEGHIYENFVGTKPKIKIVLNLSLKEGAKESLELNQKIENELLKNWQLSPRLNLKKAVEAGLFELPQINFIQFPRSAKARRVLILH